MALSNEMRLLVNKWTTNPFPKHLRQLEIINIRGWEGQRVEFNFPIVAIVGENGMGKSTILQAAAAIYKPPTGQPGFFASTFFPDTIWDDLQGVDIVATVIEGDTQTTISVRKPTTRWLGNENRRERVVRFLDLKRISPIYSKSGYARLAKRHLTEASAENFDVTMLQRFSTIIGKTYTLAKHALTNLDSKRKISVVSISDSNYSGFHQGAGETTIAELLSLSIPNNSLVLIDEIETSLHPRAQRRLVRDLATISRLKSVQFILTTHSAFILNELPLQARIQIIKDGTGKQVVHGVSSEFALSKMDDEHHPELDLYVEDIAAKILIEEVLAYAKLELLTRLQIVPFGAANVGRSLGIMNSQNRFPRPTLIFLDGDQEPANGCLILPGEEAPERFIFEQLKAIGWPVDIASQIGRSYSDLVDYCQTAMTMPNHHEWVKYIADRIIYGGNDLWRAMCRSWVKNSYKPDPTSYMVLAIEDKLGENQ